MKPSLRIPILLLFFFAFVSLNWGISQLTSHNRSKRSVPSTTTNVSFTIEKINGWDSLTTIKVAEKASFRVTAWVPVATVDLRMEFSAPVEADGAVMALCNPKIISVGSNLGFSPSDKRTVMKSTTKDAVHDYALIDFGTISNSQVGDSTTDNYMIVMEFDVIMLNYYNLTYTSRSYFISAGASYYNKAKLWVGQGSFTVTNASLISGQLPVMNMDGPVSVIPGTTSVWKVTMVIKDAVNAIIADVYMPFNASNYFSLCRINVGGSSGEGFACYNKEAYPNTTYTKKKKVPTATLR